MTAAKRVPPRGKPGTGAKKSGRAKHKPLGPDSTVVASKGKGNISKKIRDMKRLLTKPNLDAAVRRSCEQRLVALQAEVAKRKQSSLERKLAVRYHHVRFFERQKIERRLKRLERAERVAALEQAALPEAQRAELQQARRDLLYVLHFPKGHKYVSLLKNADTPEAQAHLDAERARLRAIVDKAVADAALLAEGDEGRALAGGAGREPGSRGRGRDAAAAAAPEQQDDADMDDFFLLEEIAPVGTAPAESPGLRSNVGAKRPRLLGNRPDPESGGRRMSAEESSGEFYSAEKDKAKDDSGNESGEEPGRPGSARTAGPEKNGHPGIAAKTRCLSSGSAPQGTASGKAAGALKRSSGRGGRGGRVREEFILLQAEGQQPRGSSDRKKRPNKLQAAALMPQQ